MAEQQPTADRPFLQPLPDHDTLNVALLLWRIAERLVAAKSGCWEWTGSKNRDGYGTASSGKGRSELLHRIVFRLCVGPLEAGNKVCHECDNPCCCRPSHLFKGTHGDNMRDAARKKRLRPRDSKGERNPSVKLTVEKVRAIRSRYAAGLASAQSLAEEFGICKASVYRIIQGRTWKNDPQAVTPPTER